MKQKISIHLLALAFLVAGLAQTAAAGTKEQLIQLQTTVQILQDNMAKMQQSFDERMGVVKDLITQQTDNVNKMTTSIQTLQKSLQLQSNDSTGKVDQVQGQIQSLHDAVDELKARLAKMGKQLDDIQSTQQTISAAATQTQTPNASAAAQNQAPPADQLYNNALSDFNAGKNDLASQEFAQYIQVYGTTELAGNAQFYLGEVDYRKGNFQAAVQDYNKVLDQYPGGNKAAASQLKKGFALLELNQREAGVKELRSLISRFPKSPEAVQARERLNRLGTAGAAPHGRIPRPSPSHQ
ncbi:MAG TPA: tetratricopeptide repeat protein [Candidatus Saccharimonadales bacterium]|jgi:tol-pal system protein YbgF|nr:tetratricopeptide repeat protein [Candidatus Saccharimonadales bacterium]